MKGKILILALAAIGICANSFAYEIYKGTVTKHKEWVTGNANGTFKIDTSGRFAKLKKHSIQTDEDSYVASELAPNPLTAKVETLTTINNVYNGIYLTNATEESRHYDCEISLCTDIGEDAKACVHYIDEITLEPHGFYSNSFKPELYVTYKTADSYDFWVQTSIRKYSPTLDLGNSHSVSFGKIEVS